ncbi:hypothetical protein DL765_005340 [Monosporascus sp. GIB2]|nr:hypothetical protein DL765_005340 [Monosporascus sp. GIB2]
MRVTRCPQPIGPGVTFYAEFPRNPLWTRSPAPLVDVQFPFVPTGTAPSVVETYEQDAPRYSFMATIARESDYGTLKARLTGVARATPLRMEDRSLHKYLQWLLDFHGPTDKHRLYDLFPSLAHLKCRIDGKPASESAFYAPSTRSAMTPRPETQESAEEPSSAEEQPTGAQEQDTKPGNPVDEASKVQFVFDDQVTFDEEASDAMLSLFNSMDGDQKAMFTKLHEADFGHLMCSGCPGSGKTTACMILLTIMCQSRIDISKWNDLMRPPPKMTEPRSQAPDLADNGLPNLGEITYTRPENYQHPRDVLLKATEQDADEPAVPIYQDQGAAPSESAADGGLSGNDNATAAKQSTGDGILANDAPTTAQQSTDSTQGNGTTGQFTDDGGWGNATTGQSTDDGGWGSGPSACFRSMGDDNDWRCPDNAAFHTTAADFTKWELCETEESTEEQKPEKPAFYKTVALVMGGMNEQLDALAEKWANMMEYIPLRRLAITRALPPKRIIKQLSGADREWPSTYQDDTEIDEALIGLVEIEKLHRELRQRDINKPRASSPYSVPSQIADILAEGTSFLAREANSILADRRRDPVAFKKDKKDKFLRDMFKALVDLVYARSDVIIATPYVVNALVSQLKFDIALIWIDEAWRMPEPDALIALAGFESALLRLQSGDAAQLPPFCATRDTHLSKEPSRWWCNQFAPQLCKSLPERGVESGLHTFYLMKNWRATNGLAKWPSDNFYSGRMVEAQTHDETGIMRRPQEYLRAFSPRIIGNRILFNLKGETEAQVGTSWCNEAHATFARELISSIFANRLCVQEPDNQDGTLMTILVISPYEQQVHTLQREAHNLADAEWDPRLVKFRTVDAAMGDEADIVIYSNPRTSGPGFTLEASRMNVAFTRARKLEIAIVCESAFRPPHIASNANQIRFGRSLWKYMATYKAIFEYPAKRWTDLCRKCLHSHEHNQACARTRCIYCNQAHHVRQCQAAKGAFPMVPQGSALPDIAHDRQTKMLLAGVAKAQRPFAGTRNMHLTRREYLGLKDEEPENIQVPEENRVHVEAQRAKIKFARKGQNGDKDDDDQVDDFDVVVPKSHRTLTNSKENRNDRHLL